MLSSIHPLGERGRRNRWGFTVASFTVAAMVAGAAVGASLGYMGALLFAWNDPKVSLGVTSLAAIVAGVLDLTGPPPPGPERQVNEHWIGRYRGWIYGGAFGAQLGLGFVTYVVTWTVPAMFAAEFLAGSLANGAMIGAVFGLGRSLALLMAGRVTRPSDLSTFHRMMARLGPPVRRLGAYSVAVAGLVAITGVMV